MSKRTTSNSGGLLAKKPKLDDLNDFWDDDFDGDAVDDCFKEVSQQVKDSGDVTLVSSYTAFKERKNVLTSTELSASTAGEVDIVETIRELKEKYAQKEGEVSILRSNLQSLRTSCIIDQEKKQMEWKEKIDKAEKENKSIKSELEFKNLEIVNLKQRLVEVSRAATVVEQNFTQKSQNIDCDLLLQNSTKSTFCPEISSRICVNFEKHYPLKPFSVLFRTKDIYTMNSNVRSSNKVDHIANSQKHNIFKYDKVDMSYLYQELTSFVTMSVEELDSETLAPSIYRALQSLRNLLKNLHNQLKDVKAELFFENKKDVDIFYPQRHRHLMDERDKKRRRMNTKGVNRDHDNEKTDGAQIVTTDIIPPKDVDTSNLSAIADLGTEEFKIVLTKLTFVDKSEGIKRFFECQSSGVQITAPRRFGKSTFINMLEEFLMITMDKDAKPISNPESSDNYKLFMNLKLGQKHGNFVKQHCGQYPVICMSLKSVRGTTKTDVLDSLKGAICEAFKKHLYLLETAPDGSMTFKDKKIMGIGKFLRFVGDSLTELSETNVINSLKFLSEILYNHFNKKVVILVDEADAPIMSAVTDNMEDEILKYLMRLLRGMFSEGLKGNRFLERSLVSSCVRLSGVYSWEVSNQYHALFLQEKKFSETYGFTQQEVHNLFENAAFQAVNDFDGVKKWYNGYQTLNKDGAPIYSGWSVISYLSYSIQEEKKMFGIYWAVRLTGNFKRIACES